MQVDQREALDDPRPIVGIMAHAYANPLINHGSTPNNNNNNGKRKGEDESSVDQEEEEEDDPENILEQDTAAAAAANELVIDVLLAAEADTIGPEVRFLGLPRGTNFPKKKPNGGAWRGADGLRVVDSALPEGLVKRGWVHKHTRELPGTLVYLASVDVSAEADAWANTEDDIVGDLRSVVAGLAVRDVKVKGREGAEIS